MGTSGRDNARIIGWVCNIFVLKSDYGTAGDQEQAIQELINQINQNQ